MFREMWWYHATSGAKGTRHAGQVSDAYVGGQGALRLGGEGDGSKGTLGCEGGIGNCSKGALGFRGIGDVCLISHGVSPPF
eukprot:1159810-Pelagomonas_calceolata.AAC.9